MPGEHLRHDGAPCELVLIDNGSTDGTGDYLAGLAPAGACAGIKVLTNEENVGVPRAWNQGLAASAGDPVCIMNNDVIVTPGWLSGLLGYLEEHPEVGIVGPHVLWGEGNRPADLNAFARHRTAQNGHVEEDGFWGCCFLVTRAAADRIGPFDEGYEVGFWEDADYRERAARRRRARRRPDRLARRTGGGNVTRHRLVGALVVRNEAPHYLRPVLEHMSLYCDAIDCPLHSERLPRNVPGPVLWSGLRAKHFGYVRREDRLRKYRRYVLHDPEDRYGHLLDEDARLERWVD